MANYPEGPQGGDSHATVSGKNVYISRHFLVPEFKIRFGDAKRASG